MSTSTKMEHASCTDCLHWSQPRHIHEEALCLNPKASMYNQAVHEGCSLSQSVYCPEEVRKHAEHLERSTPVKRLQAIYCQPCEPDRAGYSQELGQRNGRYYTTLHLNKESLRVARKLARLFDALDAIADNLVNGLILDHLRLIALEIRGKLEAEGWTVSPINGKREKTTHWNVYPPASPTGKKIRKWRNE